MIAEWVTGIGTLALAAVAVLQDRIRDCVYHPILTASIRTAPPRCIAIPLTTQAGRHVADAYYFRIWITNLGWATAKNVEVYAAELLRERADHEWERVHAFPAMNLRWTDLPR